MTLCAAGARAGLWTRSDEALLRVAEQSGVLQAVLERLASRYEARERRLRRLHVRLLMPLLVLSTGILTAPLPALLTGDLSAWGYLWRTMAALAAIWGPAFVLRRAGRRAPGRVWPPLAGLALRLPGLGAVLRRGAYAEALDTLAALLEAGLPARDAVALTARSAPDARLQARLGTAGADLAHGIGLAAALRAAECLDEKQGYPLVLAAEESGRVGAGLLRYAAQLRGEVTDRFDLIASWGAKAVYLAVLAVVARGVLHVV